jgi:hypothetical protein
VLQEQSANARVAKLLKVHATPIAATPDPDQTAPAIATDKVCYVIARAREFDVKDANADPDSGSNPTDDGAEDVLETKPTIPSIAS